MDFLSNLLLLIIPLIFLIVSCSFMSTIRKCFKRFYPVLNNSNNKLWNFLSNENWLIISFISSAMCIGEYARNQTSSLPWEVFTHRFYNHDFLTSIIPTINVLVTDIWILFGLAEFKIQSELKNISKQTNEYVKNEMMRSLNDRKTLYFVINIIFGLLLMTKHNLLYQIFSWFHFENASITDY